MPSQNTRAAMAGLKQDDNLMEELNGALAKVYEKARAGAPLTESDYVEIVTNIAAALNPQGRITGP